MVLGFSISPILSRHWGRVPTIVVTQLASLPFMLVLGYTGSVSIAISAFICRGVLMNMGGPIATALIMDLCPPSQRAWLNAFQNITVSLAWALSAVIFGSLLKGDYRVTFAVSAGLYLLSSVLYFAFFFERKHATVASESAS
jgi:MFS family permease